MDDREQAARWFAASHRAVMLHDERAAFEQWLKSPANAALFAEMQATWQALEPAAVGVAVPEGQASAPTNAVRHRRQVAAMAAFMSLTAVFLTRFDGVWWNSLDWWSR